jgi:hypothetical protein
MENNFDELVEGINISPLSTDILHQITLFLKQQTDESLSLFVPQSLQSLLILQHWAWQLLTQDSKQWIGQPSYLEVLHTLASFTKQIIFKCNTIGDDIKASLLIPETIDQVSQIFQQIERSTDDNDPFITIASLWFDNLSFYIREYPQSGSLPVVIHINQYFAENFLQTKQFKSYLTQLYQPKLLPSIFTAKQLFYMKTCSFSLNAYFYTKPQKFSFSAHEIIQHLRNGYLQMIQVQSFNVELWNENLIACVTHLIGFICACCWWNRKGEELMKILFPTEQILCDYIQALIRIIAYEPFHKQIKTERSNDETILLDVTLLFLLNIVETQNINWFMHSMNQLPDILLKVAESSMYHRICLIVYNLLGEISTDEMLKELKLTDRLSEFFFNILEQAWHHPAKKYKQIPIPHLLRGKSFLKNSFWLGQI